MSIDLEALGFTKEELQERVVSQIVERMLDAHFYDEDGDGVTRLYRIRIDGWYWIRV